MDEHVAKIKSPREPTARAGAVDYCSQVLAQSDMHLAEGGGNRRRHARKVLLHQRFEIGAKDRSWNASYARGHSSHAVENGADSAEKPAEVNPDSKLGELVLGTCGQHRLSRTADESLRREPRR